ncbi:MAG: CehA/McbA family metallohydrolase [Ferruginibacter sp.]
MRINRSERLQKKEGLILIVVFLGLFFAQWPNYAFTQGKVSDDRKKIIVQILDVNGRTTAAKIRVTAQDSIYYAPDGHLSDFIVGETGGDAMLANNRRFAYVEGTFKMNLPVTNLRFEVIKGFAYRFTDSAILILPTTDSVIIRLEKWFDFGKEKWYSGDPHVHYIDPVTAFLEMKAEDLNVCNILTSDCTTDQENFRGATDPISDSEHLIYVSQEFREDQLGHMNLLNLKKLVEPVKTMRAYQYPLNMQACDEAHAQGGHVSWAHFAAWPGLEGPLAIVMKKVDAVEILSTIDPFCEPIFVSEVVPDLRMNSGLRLWYRLLNCGLKIPATAGTDRMTNRVSVGSNRVYALVKGRFSYKTWIDALNKGSSFITNSPFLICHADNKNPGEEIHMSGNKTVTITAEMWSQLPVDRLEIIANGEVIAEKIIEKGKQYAKLEIKYKPVKSTWIAARAQQFNQEDTRSGVSFTQRRDFGGGATLLNRYYGTLRPQTAFAHTNPVYVIKDHQPIHSNEDAAYFVKYLQNSISWLQQSGRFPSEKAKQEVIAAFEKGIKEYSYLIDN